MGALQAWLDARVPAAPDALKRRIAQIVAEHPEWEAMPRSHAMLRASEFLMKEVLAAAPKDRDAALDLLAGDACVTYALEAAADEPSTFTAFADQAMQRIAKLAAEE
ncbi:MAG TPA: hypothetical protein VGJ96_15230 [Gemmatimonadaceae bacterium]|jgi:hypothetical protein